MASSGTLNIPKGYRIEQGLLWPEGDQKCAAAVFNTVSDMDHALKHVKGQRLAVQAGGNMGVWPRHLAGLFDRVITFEADPVNHRALVFNTIGYDNINVLHAALGPVTGVWCSTETPPREEGNAGAIRIAQGNRVPVLTIDSLNLPHCDMIYLDIEGTELAALSGAEVTIVRCRPVVAFEDKGLSEHFGIKKGEAEQFLARLGYRVVARPHRDVVMVPT